MKLNCDMGESFGCWAKGQDSDVMPFIDMANIACGFHASDPLTMDTTVRLAVENTVEIGAHPGYPDLVGFGRRNMHCQPDELEAMLIYQIGALDAICQKYGTEVSYIKPHGAMYNQMMKDKQMLSTIMKTVRKVRPLCPLVVMATPNNDIIRTMAHEHGIEVWFEAFSDRAYNDDGYLVPRTVSGSVYHDFTSIRNQICQIIEEGCVTTITGKKLAVDVDTICVHGDGEHAASVCQAAAVMRRSA
ncbi:5-oxoprolinase subunit PxpA [Vibrio sp. SCSIO 43132]|uniref:5-oxoprolinase subunit PxpA n=1 Tax=Vibrio sp. SCSIO 43132 TaxID=2779363 RepID=UPI001CA970BB|nr:5-oxoprolinase subunit PxpA [Vibrio sp. SCSIO 43132]UAB73011.1 5-oxoprolinase subunit PxpA [Vibrio sp. SCSIO 43132]